MGLFDLDEYLQKKARADESATPPREFPIAFEAVMFDGRRQKLRFEPILLDGGRMFISFRPETAFPECTLISGGYLNFLYKRSSLNLGDVAMPLTVGRDDAFEPEKWLSTAVHAVESKHFGRLKIVEESGKWRYQFFGSTGTIYREEYHAYRDGSHGRMIDPGYEPPLRHEYWALKNASELLVQLDDGEFWEYLEREKTDEESIYGLSIRWKDWSFEEKGRFLPAIEKEIGAAIIPLMRALVWSDPLRNSFSFLDPSYTKGKISAWKRPRFFVDQSQSVGNFYNLHAHFERRIRRIWPYIAQHFLPRVEGLLESEVHPFVLQWMDYAGAYIVEFTKPTAYEQLEARLLLRDFLAEQGVSLSAIDLDLRRQKNKE